MGTDLKRRLSEDYRHRLRFKPHYQSHESCLMADMRDSRRFWAELIADSVVECVQFKDREPTVEVDEITSEEWLANYQWLDRMIDWMCDR